MSKMIEAFGNKHSRSVTSVQDLCGALVLDIKHFEC